MLGSDVEVPVVAVSPPAWVRFFFLGWLRRIHGVRIPCCHPLTSCCIWQVLDPRERWLHSSSPRALQELSVCWATSLLFLPQQHWCRPESHTTHNTVPYETVLYYSGSPGLLLTLQSKSIVWGSPKKWKSNLILFTVTDQNITCMCNMFQRADMYI